MTILIITILTSLVAWKYAYYNSNKDNLASSCGSSDGSSSSSSSGCGSSCGGGCGGCGGS